ncbi:hypothetical protein F7725_019218 [Dissostichus mawsoni]|uniref:PiggyBac transposable element-derived protein domain-containing protein n=1 Tax=Dissostichus mawsoni TaxID=36200 RepID=A0A7J5YL83_DISMA|nr:hypothetical protein F7725_019218 [Dissostichus mawsoni]
MNLMLLISINGRSFSRSSTTSPRFFSVVRATKYIREAMMSYSSVSRFLENMMSSENAENTVVTVLLQLSGKHQAGAVEGENIEVVHQDGNAHALAEDFHRLDVVQRMREGMHKPLSPSVGLLQTERENNVARGCSIQKKGQTRPYLNASPLTVKGRGRGRGKGKKTSLTPEEPGAVWNGPEVPDTAQQLPHFCPKRAPGVQGFVASNLICKNINKNAEKEQTKGKKFVWEELKPVKFLMYVGLMMFMPLLKLPKVRDYWRKGSHLSVLFPASVMTRDRFMAISRAVHLSDPDHDLANDRKRTPRVRSTPSPKTTSSHHKRGMQGNVAA